jgi:hypothetical protein
VSFFHAGVIFAAEFYALSSPVTVTTPDPGTLVLLAVGALLSWVGICIERGHTRAKLSCRSPQRRKAVTEDAMTGRHQPYLA